ncbi:MAG: hypothetical protein B7Y57_29085 [Rhodospirillales bacterium 35-66-84]|jgi:hypothetical protein|nr:MAG: hypothetical protein B7Y57_29085 [Rhodospirillales bacterium 35-66-84]OZB20985.1 MAG: hypothetical protein B7X63_29060 [Rhodospirillales bacterium 39-66-50]
MHDVLGDFTQRANEIELTLPEGSRERELYRKIIDQIDPNKVARLQELHRAELTHYLSDDPRVDPSGPEKYVDIPFYISARIRSVLALGFADCQPKDILDIGAGPGHFGAICNGLGHRTLAIDVEFQLYEDLCEALGVERQVCPVYRQEKLSSFGKKFDIVTAIWICFDLIGKDDRGHRIYWSIKDWRFLVDDLFAHHIKDDGEIYFVLNFQLDKDGAGQYDRDLLDWFGSVGAAVDPPSGTIRLKKEIYNAPIVLPGGVAEPSLVRGAGEAAEKATVRPSVPREAKSPKPYTRQIRPLILDAKTVPLEYFESLGGKEAYFKSVEPFEKEAYSILGTFPIAGGVNSTGSSRPQFREREVCFDDFGEFYFYSQIGAFKTLLLDPTSSRQQVILGIFSFVARNCVHSLADQWKYQINGLSRAFDLSALVQKLFFSDQPLMLQCSGIAEFLVGVLEHQGIKARVIHLIRGENLDGHIVVEAFDSETGKWIYLDADYGVVLKSNDGFMSVDDLFASVSANDLSFSVVDCAKKFWMVPERNFPLKFVGEVTWLPQHNSNLPCADEGRYKEMLKRYVQIIKRYEYGFTFSWHGQRTSTLHS